MIATNFTNSGSSNDPKLTVLSFGGGQDSTALLYKLIFDADFRAQQAPNDLVVVMADTQDEHPATLQHVRECMALCAEHGIEFVHITEDMGFLSDTWAGGLRGFYARKNTVGSKAFPKTCTDNLKIRPIYKWLEAYVEDKYGFKAGRKSGLKKFAAEHGKIRVMIGIAAGEERRMADPDAKNSKGEYTTAAWMRLAIDRVYPLVPMQMDRQACQDYIASTGRSVPMPSNCILCPFMSEQELLWLYRTMPEDFAAWVQIEQNKINANLHMGDRNLGVWGRKLLPQKLAEAQEKFGHMTMDELNEYKMSHGHCVTSQY
jgi:3'-phosphoadenosine 5'-phosphosulfate sulfotransferase (PAPS reductase)/FAD synthetase